MGQINCQVEPPGVAWTTRQLIGHSRPARAAGDFTPSDQCAPGGCSRVSLSIVSSFYAESSHFLGDGDAPTPTVTQFCDRTASHVAHHLTPNDLRNLKRRLRFLTPKMALAMALELTPLASQRNFDFLQNSAGSRDLLTPTSTDTE